MIVRCLHVSNIIIQIVSLSWSVGSRFLKCYVSHSILTLTVGKNFLCLHNVSHLEERIGSAAVATMAQLYRELVYNGVVATYVNCVWDPNNRDFIIVFANSSMSSFHVTV